MAPVRWERKKQSVQPRVLVPSDSECDLVSLSSWEGFGRARKSPFLPPTPCTIPDPDKPEGNAVFIILHIQKGPWRIWLPCVNPFCSFSTKTPK